jgi:hypothetical protein
VQGAFKFILQVRLREIRETEYYKMKESTKTTEYKKTKLIRAYKTSTSPMKERPDFSKQLLSQLSHPCLWLSSDESARQSSPVTPKCAAQYLSRGIPRHPSTLGENARPMVGVRITGARKTATRTGRANYPLSDCFGTWVRPAWLRSSVAAYWQNIANQIKFHRRQHCRALQTSSDFVDLSA